MSKSVPVRTVLNLGVRASLVSGRYVFDPSKLSQFGYSDKQVAALNAVLTEIVSETELLILRAAEKIEDMK